MQFAWDTHKRAANLAKHGLDFADVAFFGWSQAIIREARPSRWGSPRLKAVGLFDGEPTAVIFSTLGTEAISIISFRPAGRNERKWLHHDETPN